jgi:hypothetical protein
MRALVEKWYILDDNAVPKEYVLRNLSDKDDPEYWRDFEPMLAALRGVPFDTHRYPGLVVGRSVTEWEVRAAFSEYPVEREQSSLVWSHRRLDGEVDHRDYRDTPAGPRKQAFDRLISDGLAAATADRQTYSSWRTTGISRERLAGWVNRKLAKEWGVKAAVRTWHIVTSGYDAVH